MTRRQLSLNRIYGAFVCLALTLTGSASMAQEVVTGLEPFRAQSTQVRYQQEMEALREKYGFGNNNRNRNRQRPHSDIRQQAYHQPTSARAPEPIPAPEPVSQQQEDVGAMDDPFNENAGEYGANYPPGGGNGYSNGGAMYDDGNGDGYDDGPYGDCCESFCCPRRKCLFDFLANSELWENASIFGGVQGFKSGPDLGILGNFGFHGGINWAAPLFDCLGIGFQSGGQIIQSDLSGGLRSAHRTQLFYTGGLFRRAQRCWDVQGGAVLDYLHDEYYVNMDIAQVRGEISLAGPCRNDVGFWGAFHVHSDQATLGPLQFNWQAVDMYTIFARHKFCNGATARIWTGATGNGEALVGGEATAPLNCSWSLATNFNYRIPKSSDENREDTNFTREAWGMSISLVWTPRANRQCNPCCPNFYRPLFNVADNTTMFIDQTQIVTTPPQ